MAGIYLHIPFCKQACHYCNFHFSTSMRQKDEMVDAILKELELQRDYLNGEKVKTIYLGGGTPSLLNGNDLDSILKKINEIHEVTADAEITLEANPDDLTLEKINELADSPLNRLSIGVQSFSEEDLKFMNRAHNSREAIECIENAKKLGFKNMTIDLIYGTPTMSDEQWEVNMQTAFDFKIPHLSCYCLTVEPNTALDHFVKKKKAKPVNDEQAARQFEQLIERCEQQGYDHYEISNFGKPGCYSMHNSAYWLGEKYLGIGPAAHSFDGQSRQWNIAHNAKYITSLKQEELLFEKEELTPESRYNEYVMTSLRTIWGTDFYKIETTFQSHFLKEITPYLQSEHVIKSEQKFRLTKKGKLLADKIAMELFI